MKGKSAGRDRGDAPSVGFAAALGRRRTWTHVPDFRFIQETAEFAVADLDV